MKEKQLKELKLTKNIIIPFPNFQPNTIISPTQMNDNFEEIEYAYNNLIDLHNGVISKVEDSLNRSDETIDRVQGVENDLQDSERKRILNENTRITNESARTSSENIRRENENTRIANEVQREQQELERISTYQTHINDEIKREEKHNQMIGTFNEKVGELDEAISSIPTKEELKGEKGDKGDKGDKGEKGEKGDKGDDGTSISIKGSVDNEEMLPASGLPGDGWLIQGELFVWNEEGSNWVNVGNIKGEKGDKGDIGETPSITHLEIKVDEKLNELDEKLSITENTKYTTTNGIKEFSCKDGYVDNVVIEGETLVNLANPSNIFVYDGVRYLNGMKYAKPNTLHTIINFSDKHIGYTDGGIVVDIGGVVEGKSSKTFTTSNTITLSQILIYGHTVNGWGETEQDKQELKQSIVILEGDHTDKPISYFEGLKSVGQGDKIEVLSQGDNIFDGLFEYGSIKTASGALEDRTDCIRSVNYLPIDAKDLFSWNDKGYSFVTFYYDKNKNYISTGGNTPPSNARYLKFRSSYSSVQNDLNVKWVVSYEEVNGYIPPQYDKKQILTTLRSLPNGVKDTIEKRGNKYVKVQRCGEIVLNGSEDWNQPTWSKSEDWLSRNPNGFAYEVVISTLGKTTNTPIMCDKFNSESIPNSASLSIGYCALQEKYLSFATTAQSTIEQWKSELQTNPVTVVYELETPIIEELPNFNPQTFSDKTTLLLNSGVVQAEASFEVTNSLGSELEVLKNKVSDNDSKLLLKSDKGHYHSCDENMVILWRGSLNAISGDITLTDSIFNYKALIINVGNVGGGKNTSLTIYPFNIGIPTSDGKFRTNEEMYATLFSGSTPYRYYFKPSSTNIGNLYFELRTYNNTIVTTNPDSTLFNIRYIMGVK